MRVADAFGRRQRGALRWGLSVGVVLSLFALTTAPAAADAGLHLVQRLGCQRRATHHRCDPGSGWALFRHDSILTNLKSEDNLAAAI